jgi:hypothetical protein
MTRLGLGDMWSAGTRAVGRYTGTLLAVFVVQSIVALACMVAISAVLAATFARLPIWDEAVDGDLVALVYSIRHGKAALYASGGIIFGAVLLWQLASWFLVGGVYGVLAQRPEGRGDTARCFGASGTSTYLAYARLALCSLPGWFLVLFVFGVCVDLVDKRLIYALTVPQLLGPLAIAILPALFLLHVMWTITDYARVELSLRHESHDPSVVMTYVRTVFYVLRRPITLVHAGLGWLLFIVVSVGYAYLAHGHPMYGAEGAVTLFVIRQGVALSRSAIRFGVLAGQVELGKTRTLPPRRIVEVKTDAKNAA